MTRKHAIVDAEPHMVVSHGADFFGQDTHQVKALISLGPYVSSSFSWADQKKVAPLLALLENPTDQTIPADQAAIFSGQLLEASRDRFAKPKVSALARALADAAARAADAGEPWEWHLNS